MLKVVCHSGTSDVDLFENVVGIYQMPDDPDVYIERMLERNTERKAIHKVPRVKKIEVYP